MRVRLLLVLTTGLGISCSGGWRDLQNLEAELKCGMSPDEVAAVSSKHGFYFKNRRAAGDRFSHTIRREDSYDQLALRFEARELTSIQASRHTGVKRMCEYPELDLCTGQQRVRLTVEHSTRFEGARLVVDGEAPGMVRGAVSDIYLPPGDHRIELGSPHGTRLTQEIRLDLPPDCHEINPRVHFD